MSGLTTQTGPLPPPFFCKYVIRKGFKSFVLEVCVPKGVTDAFLRKYVNLKGLEQKSRELAVESWKQDGNREGDWVGMVWSRRGEIEAASVSCSVM